MKNPRLRKDGSLGLSPSVMRKERFKSVIVDFYVKGYPQRQIRELASEALGHSLSAQFITNALGQAVKEWQDTRNQQLEVHKAVELEKINHLERVYWEAWDRSTGNTTSTIETKKKSGEKPRLAITDVRETSKANVGDPQYLRGIQWCIEQRCKLLGTDVPQVAVQVNNNTTQNNNNVTTTVFQRNVFFRTRVTTLAPQEIAEKIEE